MLPPARWKRGRATRCEPAGRPRGAPASTVRAPGCLRWQVIAADEYVARVDRLREVDDGVVALVVSGAGAAAGALAAGSGGGAGGASAAGRRFRRSEEGAWLAWMVRRSDVSMKVIAVAVVSLVRKFPAPLEPNSV